MDNNIFRIVLGTAIILFIPLIAMQFTDEVNWTRLDFITAGSLLLGMGLIFELATRKLPRYRLAIATILTLALLYLWAELAVGILTNWGS